MKSIAYTVMGLAALVMGPTAAWGGSLTLSASYWLTASAVGQSGNATGDRAQVKQLLTQARAALEQNNLGQAESLIAQAEAFNVKYSLFEIVDTPKKARRDLEKAKAVAGTADPFMNRTAAKVPTSSPAGQRYPETNTPNAPVIQGNATGASGDRAASDGALLAARRFLAVGDTKRADEQLEKARAQGIQYGLQEDSPAKVEAVLRKYQDVMQRRAGREQSEGWKRQYAEVLMQQAESLVLWQELDEAERLTSAAAGLGVSYAPFETNPRALLDRIAQQRTATGTPNRLSTASGSATALPVPETGNAENKQQAQKIVAQGRAALQQGDLNAASTFASQAQSLGVPDTAFEANEDRPWLLSLDVEKARTRNAGVTTAAAEGAGPRYAQQTVYDQAGDGTYNRQVQAQSPSAPGVPIAPQPARFVSDEAGAADGANGQALFQQGESALKANDKASALRYFRAANAHLDQLDETTKERLASYLQTLSGNGGGAGESLIENVAARQDVLTRKVSAEIADRQSAARRLRETDPRKSLEILSQALETIDAAQIDAASKSQLKRRVNLSVSETEKFIEVNRAQIELDERNRNVLDDVNRTRQNKMDTQQKVAEGVEEYNKLVDEHRYPEAEVVAKRLRELAPEEPVVQQLWVNARQLIRLVNNQQLLDAKENGFYTEMMNVENSGVAFDSNNALVYPDSRVWSDLSERRMEALNRQNNRRSEREMEIERKLKTPISVNFRETPIGEVVANLTRLAGINVHLDPRGLAEEGVTTDTPVSLVLEQTVSLKSALNLILEPLQLSYVIKDEVLKITSSQLKDSEVYTKTYNVADLVIPIPNFVPGNQLGLSGQLAEAYGNMGYGGGPSGSPAMAVLANNDGKNASGALHPALLSQMGAGGGTGAGMGGPPVMGPGAGPGGLGGAVEPDFDSLIELITGTIQPNTWDAVGGPGSVKEFETNLSLVISQTQDVHEEIVDLLEQLRRLQDLQVTIEVRFIRLSDDFFERIGVDFDFSIDDKTNNPNTNQPFTQAEIQNRVDTNSRQKPSLVVGLQQDGFTSNLDVPFTQGGFTAASPAFGGFDANTAAKFGFAILSDIEAFFLIEAAQGDNRSNVLEAPKVTLFNGQQAFVSDTTQRPFVISVIPVVGDFAAAQQPVIVVLSEGTHLNIQAVVSNDRRYVRLTVIPYFSQIGDVQEFTFEGSSTTTDTSSEDGLDQNGRPTDVANSTQTTSTGTTVQLPEFAFVTVTTTVSVPDGGTVLLGGIKRLSEGRNEVGVPLLSKVPYINRLFRNVGIGREAESLMMMVTPRIIIQEEEEERLGISQP